jgi:hypothetical protein
MYEMMLPIIPITACWDKPPKGFFVPNKPKNYQLDDNSFENWVQSFPIKSQKALYSLKNKITHISYKNFSLALNKNVEKFKKNKIKRFITLVEPEKSNQWVAELAHFNLDLHSTVYGRLGECAAQVFCETLNKGYYSKRKKALQNILLFDDGSFSGTQIYNHMSAIFKTCEQHNISTTIHVIIPFISQIALKKIKTLKNCNYKIYFHKFIPTLASAYKEDKKTLEIIVSTLFKKNLQSSEKKKGILWFDHKIPNNMSFPIPFRNFLPEVTTPYKTDSKNSPNNENSPVYNA